MARLTIIVPIYNKAPYLEASLASIISGEFDDFSVILVDDGSTDGSEIIAKAWDKKDTRFQYIHQDNQGLSVARNTGIDAAKTDWVTFHDADDIWHPDAVAALLGDAEKEQAEIAAGVFQRQNGDNIRVDKAFQIYQFIPDFKQDQHLAKKFSTHFSCCNKIFQRSLLKTNRFEAGLYMQDMDFWLRLLFSEYRFLQTEHVVATYIAHEGSESRQRKAERFESLFKLYDGLDQFYKDKGFQAYAQVWQFALLQGAIAFFARWKLEDRDVEGLERICKLLQEIDESVLEAFFNEKNRGNIIPILISIRDSHYDRAQIAHELGPQHFRKSLNRPATLDQIRQAIDPHAPEYEPSLMTKIRSKIGRL